MIDFSSLALSPNESRAARNFLGLSQTDAATKSSLPAHKIKRFESGNYVPEAQFTQDLRAFYEGEGYNFHDENAPGAKAKARGDVFPSGVVGSDAPTNSPAEEPGKLTRPQTANLHYMRISSQLSGDQIDRVFDCIEQNEEALHAGAVKPLAFSLWDSAPDTASKSLAIAQLRLLAENGLMYARLMGRDLLPVATSADDAKTKGKNPWKTIGELLRTVMQDLQLAVIEGNKEAQTRRKGRTAPTEVLQALVG